MGKLDGSEEVLCVPQGCVMLHGPWSGFKPISGCSQSMLDEATWMARTDDLEKDASFLQVIPYGSVWTVMKGIEKVLVYRRAPAGTEGRLHGKLSIGIGGHINPEDDTSTVSTCEYACMRRELREELGIGFHPDDQQIIELTPRGAIYSPDWTGVEAVHFGIHFEIGMPSWRINSGAMPTTEPAIDIVGWWSEYAVCDHFRNHPSEWEQWSRAVIEGYYLKGT